MINNANLLFSFLTICALACTIALTIQQKNQALTLEAKRLELLKNYNRTLKYESERLLDGMQEQVKRKPGYKPLWTAGDELRKIIDQEIKSLDRASALLENQQYKSLFSKNKTFNKHIDSHLKNLRQTDGRVFQFLEATSKFRSLGIKPDEISELYEKLSPEFETLRSGFNSNLLYPVSYAYQLEEKRNSLLKIASKTTSYLFGKIGARGMHFDKFQVLSSPKTDATELGDQFTANVFLGTSTHYPPEFISATVNGVPHKIKKGVIQFKEKPVTRGRHEYEVKFQIKNKLTGITDSFKRTFSYLVR